MNQEFYAYYNTLSTIELLQIQAAKENYQPEAVEAALIVLQLRTVTSEDQQALAEIIAAEQKQEEQKREKKQALQLLVQQAADAARPGKKTLSQQLILFCAGLSILFLFRAFNDIRTAYYIITNGRFPGLYTLLSLEDLILAPLMIFLLLKRKKAGWTIAAIIFTMSLMTAIMSVLFWWGSANDMFQLRPSFGSQLLALLINGGVLYYLNTAKMVRIFTVNTKWQFTTVILSAIFFLLLYLFR